MATAEALLTTAATVATTGTASSGKLNPVDATNGQVTITLPTGVTAGVSVVVQKIDSSSNTVVISGSINANAGTSTITLYSQYEARTLRWTGATWRVVADHRTRQQLDATYQPIPTSGTPSSTTYLRGDGVWATPPGSSSATPTTNSQTGTAYTLALGDAGNIVENTGSSVLTVTVPLNSAVAYPVGTVVEFCNYGTGSIVIAGAGTAPAATETFTGTNGAAWPSSQWTGLQLNSGAGGSGTIQSNAGALYAGSAGSYREYLSGMAGQADTDLLFSITFGSQANANFWACISADNLVASSNGNIPQNAYIFYLGENTTAAASTYGLYSIVGNGSANQFTSGTITITAGTKYTVRFQRNSGLVRFKLWAASGTEPSTWTASATDTSAPLAAGKVSFAVDNQQTVTIDDVAVSNPAGSVTLDSPSGFRLTSQFASAAIRKRATDEWVVSGLTVN